MVVLEVVVLQVVGKKMKKYPKGIKIYTDYFSEPGVYEEYILRDISISGSNICPKLVNSNGEIITPYNFYLHIKKFNKYFYTINELRAKKLKNL